MRVGTSGNCRGLHGYMEVRHIICSTFAVFKSPRQIKRQMINWENVFSAYVIKG